MDGSQAGPVAGSEFEFNLDAGTLADIFENKTRSFDLDPSDSFQKLSLADQRAASHLVKAAVILNDVFLQQDHPDNLRARDFLMAAAETGNHAATQALTLFVIFNGIEGNDMYAPKTVPLPLFKNRPKPLGGGLYPADITPHELADYIVAHPEQTGQILNNNTVIVRDGDLLKALPYSVAYAPQIQAIARQLIAAADEIEHDGMSRYLRLQAEALLSDTDPEVVFAAEKAWIELEGCPIEFTITRESYKDQLGAAVAADTRVGAILKEQGLKAQQKDLLGIRVGIVNPESEAIMALYRDHAQEFSEQMPLIEQYRDQSRVAGGRSTMVDIDLIAMMGEIGAVRGGIVSANNLPNPDKLSAIRGVGDRQTFHRQIRNNIGDPVQRQKMVEALLDPAQIHLFDVAYRFPWTVGHEGGHSQGPATSADGRDKGAALGKFGAMLEENKADLVSITEADYFVSIGKYTAEQANKIYLTWIFSQLPSKQPALNEAHRSREIMQINYFREKGAVLLEAGGKVSIVPEKFATVAREMLTEVISMQLEGNPDRAQAFVEKYAAWNDALQHVVETRMGLRPRLYWQMNQPLAFALAQ